MHCSHTKAADFYQMYWYRQLPGETMKRIVYTITTSKNHDFGDFSKDKFAATKPDVETGTFTVKNLEPEDKGLYFCALLNSKNLKGQVSSRISTSKLLTMMFLVMLCFLHLPGNKGASHSNRVFQTPPFIIKKAGESVTSEINCSHSITNYDQILWYKQDEQGALQFLGYLNLANPYPEDSVKGKISFDGDGQKHSRLTISDLALDDSGLIHGSDVTQTDILWKNKGENATMHCSHTKAADFFQMYWYRQLPGETMKRIVYTITTSKNHDFGDFSKDKFAATKPDVETGTFTVKNLEPEDKGLYFCALPNSKNLKGQVSSRVSTSKLLTMMFLVMLCFLHLPGNKGASHSNRVFQTPPFIIKKAGESVTSEINCSHSVTNYDRILWYKQDEQGALQFLGYLNLANPYPEDSVKGKISFDGDGRKNSRLSISDLALNDSGQSDGSDVTQTPLLWKDAGQSATMNCSHTKDISYRQMYWYRQLPGEGMKEIVFTTTTPPHKYESGFSEDKFPATKSDPQTGSLTVEKLLPEDSGVYFCAVSQHSDSGSSLSDQVYQTPADMYNNQGETATINCSHSIDYQDRILWYKQSKHKQPQFLGYMVATTGNLEKNHLDVKIVGNANKGKTCTLTIDRLSLNSSAVYFCAIRLHSDTYHCSSVQKPPHQTFFYLCIKAHRSLHLYSFL
ncbi:hypothetical protein ABVT39_004172 [Epinephelus coioides]